MRLTAEDVEGGALHVDVGADGLAVHALPQHALYAWRHIVQERQGAALRFAARPVPAQYALDAMRVALYLDKGIPECARALHIAEADRDVDQALSDQTDPQAVYIRHEMLMHRPGSIKAWRRLGVHSVSTLCQHFGVTEASLFARLARDDACLRIRTPLDDCAGVVARALATNLFNRVDVVAAQPYSAVLAVLHSLSARGAEGVEALLIREDAHDGVPDARSSVLPHMRMAVTVAIRMSKLTALHLSSAEAPGRECLERLRELSALTSLKQLHTYTVPDGFRHAQLQCLGLRKLSAQHVELPHVRRLCLALANSTTVGLRHLTKLRSLDVEVVASTGYESSLLML